MKKWNSSCEELKPISPGIVDLIGQDFFAVGWDLDGEGGGLGVDFFEGVGGFGDVPIGPAVEVFDDADFDG